MSVLIPVSYPLTLSNRAAIEKGRELVGNDTDSELLLVHINRVHKGENVTRTDLRTAVEAEFESPAAHYVVRDAVLYEAAILNEAVRFDVSHVVLSERRYNAWQQLIHDIIGGGVDLKTFLSQQLNATIHVVSVGH